MFLVVVEDRHADNDLGRALESARAREAVATVLTGDALLAMRLGRDGIDARLTIETVPLEARRKVFATRDEVALDGVASAFGGHAEAMDTRFGPYLQYTLIPPFIRAVRNVTSVDDLLSSAPQNARLGADLHVLLVGGGPLVEAARLVARRRGIPVERFGDPLRRLGQAVARLRAGRATRWVNTNLRALVLEPGFMWLLFLRGLWRRIAGSPPPAPARRAIIVVGDRFTADVVERCRDESRPIVVAGATQPGRALFEVPTRRAAGGSEARAQPIEAFTDLVDPFRWMATIVDAIAAAIRLAGDRAHSRQFTVGGVPYWPLVGRATWLHLVAWVPALRHLRSLTARVARACPDAHLLTSTDVTAYNRVLIDTAHAFGITSTGIQHGITGEPNGHSVVHVNTLAVWGEATEPWYRSHAPQTAAFIITGNPRFDSLASRLPSADRIAAPERLMAPQSPIPTIPDSQAAIRFNVTVCTGFVSEFSVGASEYENLLMLDSVLAWACARGDVGVIHKMHPGEEPEYYAEAGRTLRWDPLRLTTIREPVLYDVLERSNLLVAAYSTTVLESIALGTPAIVFDGIVQRRLLPLAGIPGVSVAFTVSELHAQLDAAHAGPPPDRAALRGGPELKAYISDLDGKATERVAALVSAAAPSRA